MSQFQGILQPLVEFQRLRNEAVKALHASGLHGEAEGLSKIRPAYITFALKNLEKFILLSTLPALKDLKAWAIVHQASFEKDSKTICN